MHDTAAFLGQTERSLGLFTKWWATALLHMTKDYPFLTLAVRGGGYFPAQPNNQNERHPPSVHPPLTNEETKSHQWQYFTKPLSLVQNHIPTPKNPKTHYHHAHHQDRRNSCRHRHQHKLRQFTQNFQTANIQRRSRYRFTTFTGQRSSFGNTDRRSPATDVRILPIAVSLSRKKHPLSATRLQSREINLHSVRRSFQRRGQHPPRCRFGSIPSTASGNRSLVSKSELPSWPGREIYR